MFSSKREVGQTLTLDGIITIRLNGLGGLDDISIEAPDDVTVVRAPCGIMVADGLIFVSLGRIKDGIANVLVEAPRHIKIKRD